MAQHIACFWNTAIEKMQWCSFLRTTYDARRTVVVTHDVRRTTYGCCHARRTTHDARSIVEPMPRLRHRQFGATPRSPCRAYPLLYASTDNRSPQRRSHESRPFATTHDRP